MSRTLRSRVTTLLVVVPSFAGLTLLVGARFHSAPTAAPLLPIIPMGNSDLKGGSTKLPEIDPASLPTSGPDAAGGVCNQVPGGPIITDLTFSIRKGSAQSLEVEGVSNSVPFGAGGTANVTLDPGIGGGQCRGYTLNGLQGADGSNIVINCTPSYTAVIGQTVVELNALPAFRFDAMSDLARNGIAELYHAGVLALVFNDDSSRALNAVAGEVSFPGTAVAAVTGVHIFEMDGDPVANATVDIVGNEFAITGFAPLSSGNVYQVVVTLTNGLGGEPMRAEIQGTFEP